MEMQTFHFRLIFYKREEQKKVIEIKQHILNDFIFVIIGGFIYGIF